MWRLFAWLGLGAAVTFGCGGDDFSSQSSGGTAGSSGAGNASGSGGAGNTAGAGNAGGASGAGNTGGSSGSGNAGGSSGSGGSSAAGGSSGTGGVATGGVGGSSGTGGVATGGVGGSSGTGGIATGGVGGTGGATGGTGGAATGGVSGTGGFGGTACAADSNANLKLHSTLDSELAVNPPLIGVQGFVKGANFITDRVCGAGAAEFPSSDNYGLRFELSATIVAQGSADFFLKPNTNCGATGLVQRYLLHLPGPGTTISIVLLSNGSFKELHATYGSSTGGVHTAKANFNCNPNVWSRIRATWDSNPGSGIPVVHLYVNGTLAATKGLGPVTGGSSTAGTTSVYVGANNNFKLAADSKLDEIKIYDKVIAP